jgi:hypothetical protein
MTKIKTAKKLPAALLNRLTKKQRRFINRLSPDLVAQLRAARVHGQPLVPWLGDKPDPLTPRARAAHTRDISIVEAWDASPEGWAQVAPDYIADAKDRIKAILAA